MVAWFRSSTSLAAAFKTLCNGASVAAGRPARTTLHYLSRGTQEQRLVVHRRHGRVVDEPSVDGAPANYGDLSVKSQISAEQEE